MRKKAHGAGSFTVAARRELRILILGPAAILFAALFSGEIRDTDIWLALKTGQRTLETRRLVVPDPFSYTTAMSAARYAGEEATRHFNLTHEWLAQSLMYAIYKLSGFAGLVLLRAMLLGAFCALTGWIAFRRGAGFAMSLAAAFAAAGVAFHFQQSRPFLVTFVGAAATMAILESRRRLWLLPPLFLVWANCHGGFFLGWLICGAYCAEALIRRWRGRPDPEERRLYLVSLACLLISGLNPNGFGVIRILAYYRASGIQSTNLEWQRPIFWEPGIYSFLLFGALITLVLARRRTRPADWLLYFGFAILSLAALRNVIFMGLIGPVILGAYAPKWRFAPVAAASLAAGALIWFDAVPAIASGDVFALRAAQWQLPVGAADFIEAHRIAARMFNSYESGGYFVWRLWPMQRDFIDPRGLSEEAYADYRRILYDPDSAGEAGAQKLLQKYGIGMLALEGFDYPTGQVYPLTVELADSPRKEWKLVYADRGAVIFMRHPPPGVEPIITDGLLTSLEAQCSEHIRHDPARPRCERGLAELYAFRHDVERARYWMASYLERPNGPDPEAERINQSLAVTSLNNEGLSLEEKGDYQGAEPLFRRAVAIASASLGPDHPDTAGSLNNLAGVLEAKGDYAAAEPLYRRALAIAEKTLGPADPRTAMSLDNLAGVLEAKGDRAAAEPLYRRALAIAEKSLGPSDPATQQIRDDLAEMLKATR